MGVVANVSESPPTVEKLRATLPTLGICTIHFRKEAGALFRALDIRRLRNIRHLGLSAQIGLETRHTRYEYVALQAAMSEWLQPFHPRHPQLAMSNHVARPSGRGKFSSGQELLKFWVLLGAAGELPETYGSVRALIRVLWEDSELRQKALLAGFPDDLADWAEAVISDQQEGKLKYVLGLRNLHAKEPEGSEVVTIAEDALRLLFLEPKALYPTSPAARAKLLKLRNVASDIRLLSMLTLDSYYSHVPLSFNAAATLANVGDLLFPSRDTADFRSILERAAAWLADELYLRPDALSCQSEYARKGQIELQNRFSKAGTNLKKQLILNEIAYHGACSNFSPSARHVIRLSFSRRTLPLLGAFDTEYSLEKRLARELNLFTPQWITVNENLFERCVYVDLGISDAENREGCHGLFLKCFSWVVERIERQMESWRDTLMQPHGASEEEWLRIQPELLKRTISEAKPLINDLLRWLLWFILGESQTISEETWDRDNMSASPLVSMRTIGGAHHDDIQPYLGGMLADDNPSGLREDDLQELRAARKAVELCKGPLVILKPSSYRISGSDGLDKDEWDALVIEFDRNCVRLRIIEAKNSGKKARRAEAAKKQLKQTAAFIKSTSSLSGRITPLETFGANLVVNLKQ